MCVCLIEQVCITRPVYKYIKKKRKKECGEERQREKKREDTIEEEGLWTRTRQSVAQNEVGEAQTCALGGR